LDEPERIVKQWTDNKVYEAIDRYYDEVVVYGLPEVFDFVKEYQIPASLARKISYAGYIDRAADADKTAEMRRRYAPNGEKLALCTVGGGGDGQELVETYLAGLEARTGGEAVRNVVVFGPDMPEAVRSSMRQRHGHRKDLVMMDFCPDMTALIAAADVVVAMGGYNTVCEILALQKKAVLVPRVAPRLEQWIRCHRLDELGLARCLHPDTATPRALWQAIDELLGAQASAQRKAVSFDGLRFVTELVRAALLAPAATQRRARQFAIEGFAHPQPARVPAYA
ncbi:MAG TPA: glycosyltransferase, partial [Burkholderiales bacterium]